MRLLDLLSICAIGLFCSAAQPQTVESHSKFGLRTAKELTKNERSGVGKSVTENILSKVDDRVVQEMDRAWRSVGAGADAKEAVLLVFRMPDGSIRARPAGITNEHKTFTIRWHPSAIAILHTHPNSVNPLPSSPDRQLAEKLRVPIFTMSIRGMFVYDPGTRTVTQVQSGLDWLALPKWKSNKVGKLSPPFGIQKSMENSTTHAGARSMSC
jgi:hypothetical protein